MAKVNISSYSGSVVGDDWSPAFSAAWDAIKATGGEIVVDVQNTVLQSGITLQPSGYLPVPVIFSGDGSNAIRINGNSSTVLFNAGNLTSLKVRDLIFTGTGLSTSEVNCSSIFRTSFVESAIFENVMIAGLGVSKGAIHNGSAGTCIIRDCIMSGGYTSTIESGMIYSELTARLVIDNCTFYDYQNLKSDYWSKSPYGVSAWIRVDNPSLGIIGNGANNPTIKISNCRFDEGAQDSVYIDGYPLVELTNNASNMISLTSELGSGYNIKNCKHVLVKQSNFGYTSNDSPAIKLVNCENVGMVGIQADHAIHKIRKDAITNLKVLQSPDIDLVDIV